MTKTDGDLRVFRVRLELQKSYHAVVPAKFRVSAIGT
jgi:hypothetical protein